MTDSQALGAVGDDLRVLVVKTPDGNWHATLYDGDLRLREVIHPWSPGLAFSFGWSARRAARRALRYERKQRRGYWREEIR